MKTNEIFVAKNVAKYIALETTHKICVHSIIKSVSTFVRTYDGNFWNRMRI